MPMLQTKEKFFVIKSTENSKEEFLFIHDDVDSMFRYTFEDSIDQASLFDSVESARSSIDEYNLLRYYKRTNIAIIQVKITTQYNY